MTTACAKTNMENKETELMPGNLAALNICSHSPTLHNRLKKQGGRYSLLHAVIEHSADPLRDYVALWSWKVFVNFWGRGKQRTSCGITYYCIFVAFHTSLSVWLSIDQQLSHESCVFFNWCPQAQLACLSCQFIFVTLTINGRSAQHVSETKRNSLGKNTETSTRQATAATELR